MFKELPKAVIFDWDNTLVDSWFLLHQAWNVTLKEMGMPEWSLATVQQRAKASMRDTFPELFGSQWLEAKEIFYNFFTNNHLTHLKPMDGATQLLDLFDYHGCYMVVVSNKNGDLLRQEATALGWDRYFKCLVGSGDAKKDKPAAEPVMLALSKSTITTCPDVWFLGDTDIDIQCAINAGCKPILIRDTKPTSDEFKYVKPDMHFFSCNQLMSFLKQGTMTR